MTALETVINGLSIIMLSPLRLNGVRCVLEILH